jgi:hypothetical protein
MFSERTRAYWLAFLIALLMVGGVVGGYFYGLNLSYSELKSLRDQVEELRPLSARLKSEVVDQSARYIDLQSKLATVQAALEAFMPAKDTYVLNPNQALVVADGRLTIGLVGSPGNDSININVNGKQQRAAPGDVVGTADASAGCQVKVQSFDMFKATVNASCGPAKP